MNEMTPYALVEVQGRSGIVRRKYKTRAGCARWAEHHGLTSVIVSPGTRVGDPITLVSEVSR